MRLRNALLSFSLVLVQLGCTTGSRTAVASSDAATPAPKASDAASARKDEHPTAKLFALTRAQRWSEAANWFDQRLAQEGKSLAPKLRYLRAAIAAELGQHELTLRWLSGLEASLPVLKEEIGQLRLTAQAHVLPTKEGAAQLAKSDDPADVLRAVDAYRRLKEPALALNVIERRLPGLERKSPRSSKLAPLLRAKAELLAQLKRPRDAAAIFKKLALELVTGEAAHEADQEYEKWSKTRLSKTQRYARAEKFVDAKDVDSFEREVTLMKTAPGSPVSEVAIQRSRAWAYYKSRKDYALAAELFLKTSKADRVHCAQDLFFSARALSRAHQDEAAAERYLQLARQHSRSRYAEQARYLAARLRFILGDLPKAEAGFVSYLERYSSGKRRGKFERQARYELSVTRLSTGKGAQAISDLSQLMAREKNDRERVALKQLLGLAHQQAGKKTKAAELFRSVIEERPLSFAALVSIARLRQMGAELPPIIPNGKAEPAPPKLDLELPAKVEMLIELGLHLEAERELDQQTTELSKRYAPDSGRALCQAYSALSTAKSRYRHGLRSIRERAVMRAIAPDTEWIWDCIYPRPYEELVELQERSRGTPEGLIHAVMRQESAFQSTVVSHAGAVGLMQLMPQTARSIAAELGREVKTNQLMTPALNIEFGAFYLAKLLQKFSGSLPVAVASYNAGPSAVARWLQAAKGLPIDLFIARIPYHETRGYVHRVVGNLARYRYVTGGPSAVPELSLSLPKAVALKDVDY